MVTPEEITRYKNEAGWFGAPSHKELRRFAMGVSLAIETRFGHIDSPNAYVNYAEFLNDLFPLVGSLRTLLSEVTEVPLAGSSLYRETFEVVKRINSFHNEWNLSYNTWYQNFKSKSPNMKELVESCRPELHKDIQSFYRYSSSMGSDVDRLLGVLKALSLWCTELADISHRIETYDRKIRWYHKLIGKKKIIDTDSKV